MTTVWNKTSSSTMVPHCVLSLCDSGYYSQATICILLSLLSSTYFATALQTQSINVRADAASRPECRPHNVSRSRSGAMGTRLRPWTKEFAYNYDDKALRHSSDKCVSMLSRCGYRYLIHLEGWGSCEVTGVDSQTRGRGVVK